MNRRHTDFQSAINSPSQKPKSLPDNDLRNNTADTSDPRAAPGAAQNTPDAQLAAVIQAWPGLPEAVRARIAGMVEGATAAADGPGPTVVASPGGA